MESNFKIPFKITPATTLTPISLFYHRQVDSNQNREVIVITLDPTYFTEEVLTRILTFLYTGVVDLQKDSEQLAETMTAAHFLNLPELVTICENAQKGDEFLNPSIGTWLNDRNSEVAKTLFFNQVSSDASLLLLGNMGGRGGCGRSLREGRVPPPSLYTGSYNIIFPKSQLQF